jgi:hypothetical protein
MEEALARANAELDMSEGISSNVVERFRRFEREVSNFTIQRSPVGLTVIAYAIGVGGQEAGSGAAKGCAESQINFGESADEAHLSRTSQLMNRTNSSPPSIVS